MGFSDLNDNSIFDPIGSFYAARQQKQAYKQQNNDILWQKIQAQALADKMRGLPQGQAQVPNAMATHPSVFQNIGNAFSGAVNRIMHRPAPQAPQMAAQPVMNAPQPQAVTPPITEQGLPQGQIVPQMPDMTQQAPDGMVYGADGKLTNGETVGVTGQRTLKPIRVPNEYDSNDALLRQAWAFGQQTNDYSHFNELATKQQALNLEKQQKERAQMASFAGQLLAIPKEQRAQAAAVMLGQMGLNISETPLADYVNNPNAFEQALRITMANGDTKNAIKQGIETQGTYDKFQPYQTDNLGDRFGVFNPKTGKYVGAEAVGLNPTQVRGQNMTAETQRRGQDIQKRIADNNAALRALDIKISASQGAQRIALEKQRIRLSAQGQALAREKFQYNKDNNFPAGGEIAGEPWKDYGGN